MSKIIRAQSNITLQLSNNHPIQSQIIKLQQLIYYHCAEYQAHQPRAGR